MGCVAETTYSRSGPDLPLLDLELNLTRLIFLDLELRRIILPHHIAACPLLANLWFEIAVVVFCSNHQGQRVVLDGKTALLETLNHRKDVENAFLDFWILLLGGI